MAWPQSSAYETDVANVTVAHAALATNLQAAIVGLYAGSCSVKALVVDGTGGANYATPVPSGTPVAGTVTVSRSVANTLIPTPSTIAFGEINKEQPPRAAGSFKANRTGIYAGFGIYSYSMAGGVGVYDLVLQATPTAANPNASVVQVTPASPGNTCTITKGVDGGGRLTLHLIFATSDTDFDLVAWVF